MIFSSERFALIGSVIEVLMWTFLLNAEPRIHAAGNLRFCSKYSPFFYALRAVPRVTSASDSTLQRAVKISVEQQLTNIESSALPPSVDSDGTVTQATP